ncbi:beta-lactamase [Stemphylium lycopersici]|uniref:Transesterase (LovD) n=1 Tax=Stemphylium lycopersici TaxID=183478 RepID=A0A364MY28_STELY|nr:beta-lactamase [Stemphylium lycopersici]RAR06828.1 transesterase (LovD) [Stemphylium lycopersici]
MTKFLTCIAVLQCVERGQLELDGDVAKVMPELKHPRILLSHEEGQEPVYRPASQPVTLRHLLTHTGGLSNWNPNFNRLPKTKAREGKPFLHDDVLDAFHFELIREPGTEFEYASGVDFAGKMVERANPGHTLGSYLQTHVFSPLDIHDATFHLEQHTEAFRARIPPAYIRNGDDPTGALSPFSLQTIIQDPITGDFGRGGLYTTASSLLKIYAAILRRDERILRPESLDALFTPQLPGDGRAGVPKGLDTYFDADNAYSRAVLGTIPSGSLINFGLGELMPGVDVEGRRSKESIAWSGGANCYWWIDKKKGVAGLYLSQLRPHGDKKTVEFLTAFEDAVYRTVG